MNKKLLISALLVFAGASQVFASQNDGENCGENVGTVTPTSDAPTATSTPAAKASCFARCKATALNGYTYTANHVAGAKNSAFTAGRKAAATTRKAVNFGRSSVKTVAGKTHNSLNNLLNSNVALFFALNHKFDLVGKTQTAANSVHSKLPARTQAAIALAANKASVVTTPIANAYNKAADVVNNALEVAVKPFGINGNEAKNAAANAFLAFKAKTVLFQLSR